MILGNHISKQKTWDDMFKIAIDYGMTTFQFFTKSPKSFNFVKTKISKSDAEAIREKYYEPNGPLHSSFIHAQYILGFASSTINKKKIDSIIDDLNVADALGCKGTVLHPGSYKKLMEEKDAVKLFIENMQKLVQEKEAQKLKSKIILENEAQTKNSKKIFSSPDQMYKIWKKLKKLKIDHHFAVCFDSCHMAVTMNTGKSTKSISKSLGKMIDKGMPIILLHYNDAKVLTADRHAYPDEGLIDPKELKNIREFAKKQSIPMVIEMAIKDTAEEMKKVYKNLQ